MNITRISIDRPRLLAVFYILVILAGIYSFRLLNYELVPQFSPPVITAVTVYPGASSREVEQEVTTRIEDAFASLENIETITSTSRDNFSLVKLELVPGADVDEVLQNASRKLMSVAGSLPSEVRAPVLSRFDFNDLPIIRLALFSDMNTTELTRFCREQAIPLFSQINGVADVSLTGGSEEQVTVSVDPERLKMHNVSLLQVLNAVGKNNRNIPAGNVESEDLNIPVEMRGRFRTLDELRNLVVFKHNDYGILVRVGDVAEVYEAPAPELVFSRLNGQPAIGMNIKKQSDANAVEISEKVRAAITSLEKNHADTHLSFEFIQDNSEFTREAARSVGLDLMLAILLVSLVLLVFLQNLRNALIVFLSIPMSLLATFLVMYLWGYSLNLITLLGLTLSIGILVDDSIVVIENINRHLKMGKSPRKAAIDGRMEIGFTALSITLIDVVVFVPIILSDGMVADMLRPFSVVVVASTLMSLLVSFTLVPYFASRFNRVDDQQSEMLLKMGVRVEDYIEKAISEVTGILQWCYRYPKLVLLTAYLAFAGSILFIPAGFIGVEFTKGGDRSEFIMELELAPNTPLSESDKVAGKVEDILRSYRDVETVYTSVGVTSSGRIVANTPYLSEVFVKLKPRSEREYKTSDFSRHIKYELMQRIPGLKVRPVEINLIGLRDDDAVQVTLTGISRDSLALAARRVYHLLDSIPGAIELQSTIDEGRWIISISPDREAMEMQDIDLLQAGMTLRTAINGSDEFRFSKADRNIPVQVIMNEKSRNSVSDLKNLTVLSGTGAHIPLSGFSSVEESFLASSIERINRAPSVTIKAQVIGRPAGTVSNVLKEEIGKMGLSSGISLVWGGATKRTQDGLTSLTIALIVSILLIYLVLTALYNSFSYPWVVLFAIPLAVVGAFLTLALNMEALSVFTVLGLIILVGLIGKNSILLVDFANKLQLKSLNARDAITESVRIRFRPILMTSLAMIIGLMPVALSGGAGAEWKNGMAWALIGGLTSSLFLSFIVVPIIYLAVHKIFKKDLEQETKSSHII